MEIILKTNINQEFKRVAGHIDRNLFEYLLPPRFIARLVRYDGSAPGSVVHIRFTFPWPSDWISKIISERRDAGLYEFVDVGEKLPYGLKSWKHRHIVKKADKNNTLIVDEIQFSTGLRLIDFLAYPALFLAFSPRKKQYKRYFERNLKTP
jgi:ligand-binding SRPBCC domain-containing protein